MADAPEVEDMGMPRSPFPERRLPGATEDLPMDVELLKVLASDSRRDILQNLRKRRMTLTELAHALDLKKATVLEHLKKLTDAGLIRRLEDERLWVYYELTHRGGRIVSPTRTRFYLLMGVAAAALVMGGVAVALLADQADVLGGPAGNDAATRSEATGSAPLLAGGGGVSIDVVLSEESAGTARAYLVTASDAEALRADDGAVAGIPLGLEGSRGDVARFRSLSAVPPGTYYLYVVDAEGRDNLKSLSEVRVPSLDVRAPAVLWRGLSDDADFAVARDGAAAEGTILLAAGDGNELPTLALANGTATLDEATLDRLVPTRYQLQYLPPGSQYWITLDEAVEVRESYFAVEPRFALEGAPTRYVLTMAGAGTAVDGLDAPLFDGEPALEWRVEPDGSGVEATHTADAFGELPVRVGRLDPRAVEVVPDVRVRLDADANTTTLTLHKRDGAPYPEVAVGLGNRTLDLTDANGTLAFAPPPPGAYELRLTLPTGGFVARGVAFDGTGWHAAPQEIRIRGSEASVEGANVVAKGELLNDAVAAERVTLALVVDGRTVATEAVTAAPRSQVNVTLSAPMRLPPGEHAVRLTATPLAGSPLSASSPAAHPAAPAATPTYAGSAGWSLSDDAAARDEASGQVTLIVPAEAAPTPEPVVLERRTALEPQGRDVAEPMDSPSARTPGAPLVLVLLVVAAVAVLTRWASPRSPGRRP